MGRQLRYDDEGLWHHVYNRGASRLPIFKDDPDRQLFLALLLRATQRTNVQVHAYCLMGNHYHLLLHTPHGRLPDTMQYLSAVFTRRFNRRHGKDGALFRGRYQSVLVESDQHLLTEVRYIHRNPLDLPSAPRLDAYRWSSHAAYIGKVRRPSWLKTSEVLPHFGNDRGKFRQFVEFPAVGTDALPRTG